MKKIFLFIFLFLFLVPIFTSAQGLVPCGRSIDEPTTGINESDPCQLCHIFVLFENIVNFLLLGDPLNGVLPIVLDIAIIMIVWAGLMFMFAYMGGGGPGGINKAKSLLTSVLIGLLIVYGGWIVVNTILVAFDII